MDPIVERVEVWAARIEDKASRLAAILAGLRQAGADLHFILARWAPEPSGRSVVFVAPPYGDAELQAAAALGFQPTASVHAVRVEGENRPGIAAELTALLAAAGINLRGLSAAVLGTLFVLYLGLDSAADAATAASILQQA